jgi:hypothetical protein
MLTYSRRLWPFALALLVVGAAAGPGLAQAPPPPAGPTVSPYLNLLRRGNSPGVNYYGLVRPQIETRNSLRAQQATNAALASLASPTDPETGLPVSGHLAVFQNTGGYFLSSTGGVRAPSRSPGLPANAGVPPPRRR